MPDSDKLTPAAIEENGKIFEKFGFTPMQGRIIAYFMVSDPPEKTFNELVRYFKASKSSVSISLNFLLQNKLIDYKTFALDRKRYFYITDSFFKGYFSKVLENVAELKDYAYRTAAMRSPEYPEANEKILVWIEDANRFQEALVKAFEDIDNKS